MKIGLINSTVRGKLGFDDQLLCDALMREGHIVECLFWDDPQERFDSCDVYINRSTFEYHKTPEKFMAWLDTMEDQDIPLLNSPSIFRWNMNKTYLRELDEAGIPTIPSLFIEDLPPAQALRLIQRAPWTDIVLKPFVGAASHKIARFNKDDITARSLINFCEPCCSSPDQKINVIIQPFMKQFQEDGELSLVFFGSEFSHAILKTCGNDDFRVQGRFGGTCEKIDINQSIIEQAARALQINDLDQDLLYARVDGFMNNGVFTVSELEIIEPWLFFTEHPDSIAHFVKRMDEMTSTTLTSGIISGQTAIEMETTA